MRVAYRNMQNGLRIHTGCVWEHEGSMQGVFRMGFHLQEAGRATGAARDLPVSHVARCAVAPPTHMVTLSSMVAGTVLAAVLAECPWWAGLGTDSSLKQSRESQGAVSREVGATSSLIGISGFHSSNHKWGTL